MASNRPTFDSLRIKPRVGSEMLLFKEAQMAPPGPEGGMPPSVGQSPVTGNPDEMQAPESASQKQYEDDFGSLAYQFVQDRAPALIPYMLGFEVVDRNEDGSKAVGIFGYKVDDDFYYIPAFFLNNQVRGIDMMLSKKTNQFIPLEEKWIDYVINKHAVSIGGPADDRVRDTMRSPDLSFVQRPQVALGKVAENTEEEVPWTPMQAWEHIKEATAKVMADPQFKEMLAGITGTVEKCAESKYVKDFMEKVGGPEAMSGLFKALHDPAFANATLKLYKGAEAFWTEKLAGAAIHVDRMKKIAAAKPKIRITDSTEGLVEPADLSKTAQDTPAADIGEPEDKALSVEENARQIVEHDFTIEDRRDDSETAKVTDKEALVDFEHRFQPPDEPGMYNFVMSDGMTREGVMLNAVLSPSCGDNHTLVCFEDDGIVLAEADPRALIATESPEDSKKEDTGNDIKALYDKAKPMSDIEVEPEDGKPYLFIDDKGNAAGPFYIMFAIADGDHVRFGTGYGSDASIVTSSPSVSLEPEYGFMDWNLEDRYHDFDGRRTKGDRCCCCEPCGFSAFITLGTFKGMPKKTNAGVIIPQDWKALPLREFPRNAPYIEGESHEKRRAREAEYAERRADVESKYTFGDTSDILESMSSQGVERVKIASDGTSYYFQVDGAPRQHGPMNYKQAAVDLVARFGFRPRRAFSTLAKAASDGSVRLLVQVPSLMPKTEKTAQDNLVNVAMPAPQEQLPAIDPYSGVPVYSSPYVDVTHGQYTGVPGLPPEGGMTHGINFGGEMERNMGGGEVPDEHTDSMDGALPIDEEAKLLAQQAAEAGQRHVFDQAAIGGLVKVYDVANVVDSYIPEFMDTIDRLGRILFLFYWKHEDFNQRYGSDDVVQMEDRLRSVFKQLGDLALQLKEKAVHKD